MRAEKVGRAFCFTAKRKGIGMNAIGQDTDLSLMINNFIHVMNSSRRRLWKSSYITVEPPLPFFLHCSREWLLNVQCVPLACELYSLPQYRRDALLVPRIVPFNNDTPGGIVANRSGFSVCLVDFKYAVFSIHV